MRTRRYVINGVNQSSEVVYRDTFYAPSLAEARERANQACEGRADIVLFARANHSRPVRLTEAYGARAKEALSQVYNGSGHDIWGDRTPSDAEFVDVLCDLFEPHALGLGMSHADVRLFWALPRAQKRAMCLEVGP